MTKPASTPAPLLTTAQAAARLRMSPRQVARQAQRGRLSYAQQLPGLTGPYLFSADDLEKYEQGRDRQPA